jgi:hypothetical protein
VGGRWLFASKDRLGFVSLQSPRHNTWIEVGYGGNLLGLYELNSEGGLSYEAPAMTAASGVYARIWKDRQSGWWVVLDRATKSWHKVMGYPRGELIGAEGDYLIFSRREGGWTVLHSVLSGSLYIDKAAEQRPEASSTPGI